MTVTIFTADDGVHGPELWRTDGTAAGTYLLADIDPGATGSNISDLVADGGIVYFSASDGTSDELWRTDGTVAGTYALSTAADGANPTHITAVGSQIFYLGSDTAHGAGLFVTDGTSAGTQFLGAFNGVESLTAFDGKLAYTAPDGSGGVDLWITDGTAAGTHLVKDVTYTTGSSLTVAGGELFLQAGNTLSSSDGTTAGTTFLGAVFGGVPTPLGFADGKLFFSAGYNLWTTDGTANGTVELAQTDYAIQYDSASVGDRFYFDNIISGTSNDGLYVTDGTAAGTTLLGPIYGLSEITQVGQNIVFGGYESSASGLFVSNGTAGGTALVADGAITYGSLTVADGRAYFYFTPTGGDTQVWVSDGTAAGTHMIYDPGPGGDVSGGLVGLGGQVLFGSSTTGYNNEPWISDGSGAHQVVDLNPPVGVPVGIAATAGSAVDLAGKLVFAADLGGANDGVYVTSGAAATTAPLFDRPPGDSPVGVSDLMVVGSHAFFVVGTPTAPPTEPTLAELYGGDSGDGGDGIDAEISGAGSVSVVVSTGDIVFAGIGTGAGILVGGGDGASSGASPESTGLWSSQGVPGDAVDLTPGFSAYYLTPFAGQLYFGAYNGSVYGLFETNGTLAGTSLAAQVAVESQPVVLNGELLFAGDYGNLYAWDGSALTMLSSAVEVSDVTVSGGKAFFSAYTPTTGQELWVTDGAIGGTSMVADINPGSPSANPTQLTPYDGGVIFTAYDLTHGEQVWFSDGTAGGTELLDINTTINPAASLYVYSTVQFGGKAYFVGNDGLHGDQLWSTDGATAGTTVVADLAPGVSGPDAHFFTPLNGKLFFVDQDNAWVTDGTSAGTTELSGAYGQVSEPILLDGEVYFRGYTTANPAYSDGLFVTDGTDAGTQQIFADGNPVATAGDDLFFTGYDQTDGGGLFSYDALTHTTTLLSTLADSVGDAVSIDGELYFGFTNSTEVTSLWKSDGTAAGTVQVEAAPASSDGFASLTVLGGKLYFSSDGTSGGLWVSDGTSAGTSEVATLAVRGGSLTAIGSKLYFIATDTAHGTEVWSYDPAVGTASLVVDANPGPAGSSPTAITADGSGGAYFVASDATSIQELWHVDATGHVVELTSPTDGELYGYGSGEPLTTIGGTLFFGGSDSVHGAGLFVTNGSNVTFLASVTINSPLSFSVVGNLLYFQGYDATNGSELWVSDGTAAGTHRVTDTVAPVSANASEFTAADGQVFFSATDGVHGQELWTFSGAPGAAHMVADLNPGPGDSSPSDLMAFDGLLYFVASNGVSSELWRSDGTAADTVAITSAANGGSPQFLTADGDKLFFYGSDSVHGSGLFVTDGAPGDATFLLAYTLPSGAAGDFTVSDGDLYFNGPGANGAVELWKSDGTVDGTVAVGEVSVDNGSDPQNFIPLQTVAPNDFNGDGVSDFLIENTAGMVVVGEVANGQAGYATISSLGPEWSFKGEGDFLGEGRDQFLIENAAGAVAVGEVVNGQGSYTQVAALGPEWTFHGVGDFLAHGDSQFLIENTLGVVAVGEVVNGQAAYTDVASLGPEWQFVGAGDFLGAGQSQFLIENTSGAVVVGDVVNGQASYTQVAALGPEWSFEGTGDFLGDGKDDFLIENAAGAVYVGDVGPGGQTTFTAITSLGPEWKFVGTGDYLGEGHDQFLIENNSGAVDVGDFTGGQIHFTQVAALGSEWAFH